MKNEVLMTTFGASIAERIDSKAVHVAVIGLGYVGLPLAVTAASAGFRTTGFDIDQSKPKLIHDGVSYIGAVSAEKLGECVSSGLLDATTDFSRLCDADVIVICVPTPLTKHREPDLSFVEDTAQSIAKTLRSGQLIVLESTTWPGTTRELLKPILETSGLIAGEDFFLGFSPEREDPGNVSFETRTIPKVVAGDGAIASRLVSAFYGSIVEKIVPVSSTATAEAVKIVENAFRSINIALVNELKVIFDAMGIDIWEVIEAASTKPFGYMPFYPGPGLGGHCIPIDPFYLTWKAREFDLATRLIELAGEINSKMPRHVVDRLQQALDKTQQISLGSSSILVIGLAYKKNVSDIRESPALKIIEILRERGALVAYYDPYVHVIPSTREHQEIKDWRSIELNADAIIQYNAAIIVTDHDCIDYGLIVKNASIVIDTRNACARRNLFGTNVIKA